MSVYRLSSLSSTTSSRACAPCGAGLPLDKGSTLLGGSYAAKVRSDIRYNSVDASDHSSLSHQKMDGSNNDNRFTFVIGNTVADLLKVVDFVDKFGTLHSISQKIINALNLSLDELLNNTISYGYDDQLPHSIALSLSLTSGWLIAEIQDDGKPFDPREGKCAAIEGTLQSRQVGGLGLSFVKALMDEVDYNRGGQYNIVKIKIKLAGD
jgi:serine/threonine-protein kinase RsbW